MGARQYIDKILADSEVTLNKSQETIRAMRVELRQESGAPAKAIETEDEE